MNTHDTQFIESIHTTKDIILQTVAGIYTFNIFIMSSDEIIVANPERLQLVEDLAKHFERIMEFASAQKDATSEREANLQRIVELEEHQKGFASAQKEAEEQREADFQRIIELDEELAGMVNVEEPDEKLKKKYKALKKK